MGLDMVDHAAHNFLNWKKYDTIRGKKMKEEY